MTSHQVRLADAVQSGDIDTVRALIANGVDVAFVDEHNNTPLGLAYLHRRGAIARLLIAAGALPLDITPVAGGPKLGDVKRLLARHKRAVASMMIPTGPPDPTFEPLLVRGKVQGDRITLVLDQRRLPGSAPATRRALLEALGYEGLAWVKQAKIATQGAFFVGTAQPWYTLLPRSVARARKVVAQIGH